MKPMVECKIIPATIEDKELFFRFLKENFYEEEPMQSSINLSPENSDEVLTLNSLSNGYSFKTVDQYENTLGIVINGVRTPPSGEFNLQEKLKKFRDPVAYGKVLTALVITHRGSDFWNRTKADKAFHTIYLATSKEYRGLNIGKKLLERSLDLAKSLNFEFSIIECSSFYSAKIADDLGFESFFELLYKDYVDEKNNIIFNVKPPHTGIKLYVKKLQ